MSAETAHQKINDIAIEKNKPIFLLGAFGGVVGEVCKTITTKAITAPLIEDWQLTNNEGYSALQEKAKQAKQNADYTKIKTVLEDISVSDLAKSSGLTQEDYQRLMESPFIDECVHLVIKGLKEIAASGVSSKTEKHDE